MLLPIAIVQTLTDQQWMIEDRPIETSLAWIRYASASAAFVLQRDGPRLANPKVEWVAGRISAFLAARGFASRNDLIADYSWAASASDDRRRCHRTSDRYGAGHAANGGSAAGRPRARKAGNGLPVREAN